MYEISFDLVDFKGEPYTETCHFNLNKAELLEMELRTPGGLEGMIDRVTKGNNKSEMLDAFRLFVFSSYGVLSDDGRNLWKSEELNRKFEQSPAYPELLFKLTTDDVVAAEFINGIMPAELAAEIVKLAKEGKIEGMSEGQINALKNASPSMVGMSAADAGVEMPSTPKLVNMPTTNAPG